MPNLVATATKRIYLHRHERESIADEMNQLLATGAPEVKVLNAVIERYGISRRSAYRLSVLARQRALERVGKPVEELRADLYAQAESVYLEARKKGNLKSANDALRIKARLVGANAPEKHQVELVHIQLRAALGEVGSVLSELLDPADADRIVTALLLRTAAAAAEAGKARAPLVLERATGPLSG